MKYDYMVVDTWPGDILATLTVQGAAGWRLHTVVTYKGSESQLIFERLHDPTSD